MTQELAQIDTATPAVVDQPKLSDDAIELVVKSVPENTRRGYGEDQKRFAEWGALNSWPTLPTTPQAILQYATSLIAADRAPSTIERAISAILSSHKSAGLPRPDPELARKALVTHRYRRAKRHIDVRKAEPVTVDALRLMVSALDTSTPLGLRDRALLVLGFSLGARRSELVDLHTSDVTETADGLMVIIRTSKTDKQSLGRKVLVLYGTNPDTCPVRTTLAWVAHLAANGRTSGPLFVRVDRHGKLGVRRGRGSEDGQISAQAVAMVVNRTARAAGLNPAAAWSGHSLRRGFATEAYRTGADTLYMASHGGWQKGSKTMLGYVEEVERVTNNPLRKMGL